MVSEEQLSRAPVWQSVRDVKLRTDALVPETSVSEKVGRCRS